MNRRGVPPVFNGQILHDLLLRPRLILYISNKRNASASNHIMKRILLIALAVSTVFQAKAQRFSPESLTGAALGGLIGGFAGGNSHCGNSFSGTDAAIGAGIGLAAGALFGAVNRHRCCSSKSNALRFMPGRWRNIGPRAEICPT